MQSQKTQTKLPYQVAPTPTDEEFREQFAKFLHDDSDNFAQSDPVETQIFDYMNQYLRIEKDSLHAQTIVCETPYICLNYLEDYANYYSRTYTDYKKKCRRLHFFANEFDTSGFEEMIVDSNDFRWKSYLGCMVIKPIPRGKIGVTYLNTYSSGNVKTEGDRNAKKENKRKERHYKCLTTKTINLFGKELHVTTMPFKEQDGAVASCATTALWMAFQKTAEIFDSTAPSLSEITILAGGEENGAGRIFPTKGLSTTQVLRAISKLKMTPVIEESFGRVGYFKAALHAYIKGDIPVLLGMEGVEGERNTFNHLVTANGYRYADDKYKLGSKKYQLLSDRIEVFYVNDDQIGPFARIRIRENDRTEQIEIETTWKKRKKCVDGVTNIVASPGFIIIPLGPAIRVQFQDIYICYVPISHMFSILIAPELKVSYDIYIIRSNDYKKNLLAEKKSVYANWSVPIEKTKRQKLKEQELKDQKLKNILSTSLPKYIWVIEARDENGCRLFDFIYDTVELYYDYTPVMVNIYHCCVEEAIAAFDHSDTSIRDSFSTEYARFKNSVLCQLIIQLNGFVSIDDNNNSNNSPGGDGKADGDIEMKKDDFYEDMRNAKPKGWSKYISPRLPSQTRYGR